jgi:uncharacterized Zn finger protein (UPF0148 family)
MSHRIFQCDKCGSMLFNIGQATCYICGEELDFDEVIYGDGNDEESAEEY